MSHSIEQGLAEIFQRSATGSCDRELELCRHAAGELEGEARASFEAHLRGCEECRSNLKTLREVRPGWAAEGVRPWDRLGAALGRWRLPGVLALAATCALLVVVLQSSSPLDGELLAKGAPVLELHAAVNRGGRISRVTDGVKLESGDRLGFFYSASQVSNLTILFIDDLGEVSPLFPAGEKQSAAVAGGVEVPIPDGAVLSPGSGCEWIVGVFSASPLEVAEATRAAKSMWSARKGCTLGASPVDGAEVRVIGIER